MNVATILEAYQAAGQSAITAISLAVAAAIVCVFVVYPTVVAAGTRWTRWRHRLRLRRLRPRPFDWQVDA